MRGIEAARRSLPFTLGLLVLSCEDSSTPTTPSDVTRQAAAPARQRIAFSSDRDGNPEIYTMDPRGKDVVRLTNDPARDDSPNWSPDGSKLAFVRSGDVFVMNADGSNAANLTNSAAPDAEPTWSADGLRIAFSSRRPNVTSLNLFVINADGTNLVQLTSAEPAEDGNPSWSPDGAASRSFGVRPLGRPLRSATSSC
jgi:Tol biopolymer transport system component